MSQFEEEYNLYNAILHPYLGEDLEVGKLYYSPLPDHEDSTQSFQVFPGVNKDPNFVEDPNDKNQLNFAKMLFWKDWGYGKHLGHRPIHLVQHLNAKPDGTITMTPAEAKRKIRDSNFANVGAAVRMAVKKPITHLSSFAYTQKEVNYWKLKYGIGTDLLKKFNVMGTRVIYIDGEQVYESQSGPATFTYIGPDGKFQIYRPKPKWIRRSVGGAFLLGYEQLPYKGKILLIVSGMKDGICMHKATGWPFLAASGENDYHSFQPYMKELRQRFDYIGVCQDPDPPGRDANILLAKELGIPIFDFPYPDDEMDIADLMEKFGCTKLRNAFFLNKSFV